MQLADFGNRIPSLSFEVEADIGDVPLAALIGDFIDCGLTVESTTTIQGMAAQGARLRDVIGLLLDAFPHRLSDDGETLVLAEAVPEPTTIADSGLGAAEGPEPAARMERETAGADAAPDEIALRYYEPSRDFQAGLQRARQDGPGRRAERLDLPLTLDAERARGIAAARLERQWAERTTARVRLPWRALDLRPGAAIRLPGVAGDWRLASASLEKMALLLDLVRIGGGAVASADAAAAGRSVADPDRLHGPTVVYLLDLPALDGSVHGAPRLLIAAAGSLPGWRSAALEISLDGGASYTSIGMTAAPAVIGTAETDLTAGTSALFDGTASVDIALLHEEMCLEPCMDDALVGGANAALIGDEIVQFGRVEPIGHGRFRLSRLVRGRRGTEWAMAGHGAGERFVLLDPQTLATFDAQSGQLGADLRLLATGRGDEMAVEQAGVLVGRSIRPPGPAHVTATREGDGAIRFDWVRRSRAGWGWTDGGDAPVTEDGERWALTVQGTGGATRSATVDGGSFVYSAAAMAADGAAGESHFTVSLARLGSLARSTPDAVHHFDL